MWLGRVNMNKLVMLEMYSHALEKQMRGEVLSSYLIRNIGNRILK
jgi:hypothetical protein